MAFTPLPTTLIESLAEFDESASSGNYPSLYGDMMEAKQEREDCRPACMEGHRQKVYMDLSAPNIVLSKYAKTEYPGTVSNLLSWTAKHPENWTRLEVLDWVYYTAQEHHFDGARVCGEAYQQLTGRALCRLSREEMISLDPAYGATLYGLLRNLLEQCQFLEPLQPDTLNPGTYTSIFDASTMLANYPSCYSLRESQNSNLSVFVDDHGIQVDLAGHIYDIDVSNKLSFLDEKLADGGYVSCDSEMEHSSGDMGRCSSSDSDIFLEGAITSDDDDCTMSDMPMSPKPDHITNSSLLSLDHTRHSVSSDEGCSDVEHRDNRRRQLKRSGSATKGNHLWEFIRDMLKDSQFNPSLLRWEDKEEGVFKFVQSEAVASLWGRKKNNPAMTYEKLSRAMRFCRTAGYFADVPKTGKFPKKLCFKFGSKAHDWQH